MSYYIFSIGRPWANQHGKGVKHATLFSSTNPPTMPKGYTVYRRMGKVRTKSGKVPFPKFGKS